MNQNYIVKLDLTEAFVAFELQLMPKIEAMMDKKFQHYQAQIERNVGAIAEHFLSQVKMLAEGIQMQIEAVERLRLENSADHERYESRLSKLESKRLLRGR